MKRFMIEYEHEAAGEATLIQQGMYCKIICRLFQSYEEKCHIELWQQDNSIDLGLCAQFDSFFGCIKSLPSRSLKEENLKFLLRKNKSNICFVPIEDGKPFIHLESIVNAKLIKHHDALGIWISDSQ